MNFTLRTLSGTFWYRMTSSIKGGVIHAIGEWLDPKDGKIRIALSLSLS